jgi:hypothetical protein
MQTRLLISLPILLLGIGLRFHALARDMRFHPDEALFATFARAAAVKGDWLLHGSLDKTPLPVCCIWTSKRASSRRACRTHWQAL